MERVKKKVAIVGTQGVPAHYGGFESLVENIIGFHQSRNVAYTIFCSSPLMDKSLPRYKGADLRYVAINAHGAKSVMYDTVSLLKCLKNFDTILILGVSGCVSLPLIKRLTKAKIIVNIDGHEYRRHKWGSLARSFLKLSEGMAVRHADIVVTDNKGIQEYVAKAYGRHAELIAYGGDHAMRPVPVKMQHRHLKAYGLKPGSYSCAICRIEPENNCHLILEAFRDSGHTIAFIGNWGHSEYSQELYQKYKNCPNIHMFDSIYDLDVLYSIRANSRNYIHGHSAGGTNPSLVEAMFFGRPIFAYDVVYNRETTFNDARYFSNAAELRELLDTETYDTTDLTSSARKLYSWKSIAKCYEDLY